MGAIVNGMAAHGGFIPYGSTFLIFSDYMRPPIRLAALHGPARRARVHARQHRARRGRPDPPAGGAARCLRAIPNLTVIRPGDANETAVAWRVALETRDRPVLLVLSRQDVPTLDRDRYASADGLRRGAYVLLDAPNAHARADPDRQRLRGRPDRGRGGAPARARASPCAASRCRAGTCSRRSRRPTAIVVLPPSVTARLAVEAGVAQGWERYIGGHGDMLGVDRFGASAPAEVLLREYGFTVDNVCARAKALLRQAGSSGGRL